MRRLAVLALLLAPSIPRPSGSCSPPALDGGEHTVDASFASDTSPPSAVTATATLDLDDPSGGGGGCGTSACGDGGDYIVLDVAATDDQAPAERIGYSIKVLGGAMPDGLELPATAVLGSELLLRFNPTQPTFSFQLEVRAVDLNGNMGPATVIAISDPGYAAGMLLYLKKT